MYNINNMIYTYICTIIHKYTRTKKYIHIHVNLDVIFSTVIQSYPVALEVFSLDLGCKAWTVGTMVGAPVTSKQDSLCEMQVVVVGLDNESFREILDKAYLQITCSTFVDLRLVLKFGRFHRFLFLENTTKSHRYSHDIHWFMFWFHYRIRWMATLTCVGFATTSCRRVRHFFPSRRTGARQRATEAQWDHRVSVFWHCFLAQHLPSGTCFFLGDFMHGRWGCSSW